MRAKSARKRRSSLRPERLVRPLVRRLRAYVPGEQPKVEGLIKLNTNENAYPPAPQVLAAIRSGVDGRLRLYPNPTAQRLRERLARLHRCAPENILVGNGSDELLALATRAFVEPIAALSAKGKRRDTKRRLPRLSPATIQYFTPSYSLYPVLAAIHGAKANPVALRPDFGLPPLAELARGARWDPRAALTYVTTPNAPSGRVYGLEELEALCRAQQGVMILDEAYVDFADRSALSLALRHSHVLVTRTFSKAYSLCFLRVGYCVGHPQLIAALDKVRDSYNVNGLAQLAAEVTLDQLPYYQEKFRLIITQRSRLSQALTRLGFAVLPSQTNFLLARPPREPAVVWQEKLRQERVLVRWFDAPVVRSYLRITVGTEAEVTALLRAVERILRGAKEGRVGGRAALSLQR